ncbi:HNH endonuclease [Pseudomonas oryzihabitans]|uniref:HNH endonuclease n=1 Tax=Pseudomonas oryzihabitans TaxID=47885 RepID=UPI003B21C410
MDSDRLDLIDKQVRLILAVQRGRSDGWCLRLWSRFIKARDGHQCVVCFSTDRVQAHHIFRKSLYPHGWFQPGNGITLCHECHELQHSTFNGRPDLSLPVNAEGGDDLDDAFVYLDCLVRSADAQGLDHDEFYYIDDHMLFFFMRLQQCEHMRKFIACGEYSRLRIAHEVWRTSPPSMLAAIMRANPL